MEGQCLGHLETQYVYQTSSSVRSQQTNKQKRNNVGYQLTKQELVEKVDSEGGWPGFLQWGGVGEDDVEMDIRAKWVDVIWAWQDFQHAVDRLNQDLPQL